MSRPAYETFLSRRPWPDQLKAAVKQLSRQELDEFVDALSRSNFGRIEELLDERLTSESHGA